MRFYSPVVVLLWVMTCALVFGVIDRAATRPTEVYAEDFRQPNLTDEEVLLTAVQEARVRGYHWWWIHNSQPVVVLDSLRDYHIDPALFKLVDIPVAMKVGEGWTFVVQPIPAMRF
jgi:hypothetical protein